MIDNHVTAAAQQGHVCSVGHRGTDMANCVADEPPGVWYSFFPLTVHFHLTIIIVIYWRSFTLFPEFRLCKITFLPQFQAGDVLFYMHVWQLLNFSQTGIGRVLFSQSEPGKSLIAQPEQLLLLLYHKAVV